MASKGPLIALALLLAGGRKSSANATTEPDPDDDTKPDPDPDEPDPDPDTGDTGWVFVPPPEDFQTGELIYVPPVLNLLTALQSVVTEVPRVGHGYAIKKGDTLLGSQGIVVTALKGHLGRAPNVTERVRYYQAIVRTRANWMLYATADEHPTTGVSVIDETGGQARGSLSAAFVRMNDSWVDAAMESQLPNRLIEFTPFTNPNTGKRSFIPKGDWRTLAHGAAQQTRSYGTLMLPPYECVGSGPGQLQQTNCDWPAVIWSLSKRSAELFDGSPTAGGVWGQG